VFAAADDHRMILNKSVSLDSSAHNADTTENVPLHIIRVKPEDAGRYKCTASSDVGEDSAYVNITVLCKFACTVFNFTLSLFCFNDRLDGGERLAGGWNVARLLVSVEFLQDPITRKESASTNRRRLMRAGKSKV